MHCFSPTIYLRYGAAPIKSPNAQILPPNPLITVSRAASQQLLPRFRSARSRPKCLPLTAPSAPRARCLLWPSSHPLACCAEAAAAAAAPSAAAVAFAAAAAAAVSSACLSLPSSSCSRCTTTSKPGRCSGTGAQQSCVRGGAVAGGVWRVRTAQQQRACRAQRLVGRRWHGVVQQPAGLTAIVHVWPL